MIKPLPVIAGGFLFQRKVGCFGKSRSLFIHLEVILLWMLILLFDIGSYYILDDFHNGCAKNCRVPGYAFPGIVCEDAETLAG